MRACGFFLLAGAEECTDVADDDDDACRGGRRRARARRDKTGPPANSFRSSTARLPFRLLGTAKTKDLLLPWFPANTF